MKIRQESLGLDRLRGERGCALAKQNVLPGEIAGVVTELIGMRGPLARPEPLDPGILWDLEPCDMGPLEK